MQWDTKRLVSDCDLRQLAPWLGLKTRQIGSTTFIECLSGTHRETHTDHCEAKANGCRCYSCHVKFRTGISNPDDDWNDTIDVVRQYKRMRGEDDSFSAACETIADFLGGKERYILSGAAVQKRKEFPYTEADLKAAGFSESLQTHRMMRELFEKDERFFNSILLDKLSETIRKLKKIVEVSWDPEITEEASSRLELSAELYERLTGKKASGI